MARRRSALRTRLSDRPRPPYRPRRASSVVSALCAVGLVTGFALAETADNAPAHLRGSANLRHTHGAPAPPATRIPTLPSPATTAPTAPAPSAPPPSVAASSATPPPPGPCTPDELSITTAPATTAYQQGEVIDVTTELRAISSPCELDPVPEGAYACGTDVVVDGPPGSQVWPMPGQQEQCAQPSPTLLQPGYVEDVTMAWNQQYQDPSSGSQAQVPAGLYQAFGTWTWNAGSGMPPYSVTSASSPFAIG